jgi:hypothetical protein
MTPEPRSATAATVRVMAGGACPLRRILPNDKRAKSLQSNYTPGFNGGMKIKMLTVAAFAGCVLGCTASLQTQTIKGTVCSCTDTQITVLEQDGTHYDIIQRTASTIITPPVTPPCSAGTPVTVQCPSTDAQRKQGPCPKTTQTPPSS